MEDLNIININNIFKIPIALHNNNKIINKTVQNDLELTNSSFNNLEPPIYNYIFNPTNEIDYKIIEQISNYYTSDINYLKETQKYIDNIDKSKINQIINKYGVDNYEITKTINFWKEIRGETGFYEKYFYVDWDFAKHLNNNATFLQLKSITSFISPLISLCIPIIILILPFFILKIKGIHLSLQTYISILKELIANHAITKIFTEFHNVSNGQKIYMIFSAGLYLFSIYQNILLCIRFYSNMKKIHDYLETFKKYLLYTYETMDYYLSITQDLLEYSTHNNQVLEYKNNIKNVLVNLQQISPFKFCVEKFINMGHIMKTFYEIYDNEQTNKCILFSFGFNSYFNMTQNFKKFVSLGSINKAYFNSKKPSFKQLYYPKFINDLTTTVKNDCKLDKNIIITGPNASGKTTIIKSVLINILLAQQFGFGCFDTLNFKPYDNIHCYLNIPDTSGRDSLFQAEARRCKEIINIIDDTNNTNETHLCIFDELYSGTNPQEATDSACAFLNYLSKYSNVSYILTTHYLKICKKVKNIVNYNMETNISNEKDNLIYRYKLIKGISKIKGGVKVLRDMEYPIEIMNKLTNK